MNAALVLAMAMIVPAISAAQIDGISDESFGMARTREREPRVDCRHHRALIGIAGGSRPSS